MSSEFKFSAIFSEAELLETISALHLAEKHYIHERQLQEAESVGQLADRLIAIGTKATEAVCRYE